VKSVELSFKFLQEKVSLLVYMCSLVIQNFCLLLSQYLQLGHFFVVFLTLTQALSHTVFQFHHRVHEVITLVEVCAHYTQRYIVV